MKNSWMKMIFAAMLVMAMLAGVAALAEPADTTAAETQTTDAYQAALEQYRQARQANCLTTFEEELAQMVSGGQLTQEQADLLLEEAQSQYALSNGVCPNCGASISANRGGIGMRGGMGGGMGGGRGGRGR